MTDDNTPQDPTPNTPPNPEESPNEDAPAWDHLISLEDPSSEVDPKPAPVQDTAVEVEDESEPLQSKPAVEYEAPASPSPFEEIGESEEREAAPEESVSVEIEDVEVAVEPEIVAPDQIIEVKDPLVALEDQLLQLGNIARRAGMRTLAAEVSGDRLQALQEGRITAIVLGEFNHGKSTLLNALLGSATEILPMGITPTTAVITHLRYADRPRATIHYDDHDRVQVDPSELADVVASEQNIEPQFVEVGYPAELLRNNLVLVDTPGVNDISRQRVEITYGYLPRADVIIYVLDANQVLKQSEITFIQQRLLKSNRDRLLFVLGKVDTLDEDEREEVETYAREKLEALMGFPVELFPLSARRVLQGQKDEGFDRFRGHLDSYLTDRKAFILVDSGVSGGLRIAGMLRQNLAIKRRGYALDRSELQRRVSAVRARIGNARRAISSNLEIIDDTTKGLKVTARHNLTSFTEKFLAALPGEIERASTKDIKKHLPGWIQDTYKEWLEEEGNAIARKLEKLAQEIIETTNRNLAEAIDALQDELGLSRGAVDLNIDTLPYDVGVIAVGAIGATVAVFGSILTGGLLLLAAPVLAFVFKDKAEARLKEKALEEGQRAIEKASEMVEGEMARVIEDHGAQLKSFVESAGDRLYKQINETLEQVLKDTDARDVDRQILDERARLAEREVTEVIQHLGTIRDRLLVPSAPPKTP